MTGKDAGMIEQIGGNIEHFAGKEVRDKVMEGSEQITRQDDPAKTSEWVKQAIEKLDTLVDERTRIRIMEHCGYNCATINKDHIEKAKARSRKHKNIEEYLEAEQHNPSLGTKLTKEGNTIYWYYTPQALGVKCYCSLVKATNEKISPTYCHCAKGFAKIYWETILEKPVTVELIQSTISGAQECKFAIRPESPNPTPK